MRIGELCAECWIVALDEFQYFSRKALFPLTSEIQSELDRLTATPGIKGGLIVLGSLHTEMQALLDDRSDTEIDLVALDEGAQRLRLASCKRSAAALLADLGRFDGDVARFLNAFPRFSPWQVEKPVELRRIAQMLPSAWQLQSDFTRYYGAQALGLPSQP